MAVKVGDAEDSIWPQGEASLIGIVQDEMVVPAVAKLIEDMKIWQSGRSSHRVVFSAKMK